MSSSRRGSQRRPEGNGTSALWLAAGLCFIACALLGIIVAPRTPLRIDIEAVALRGQATALAVFFTRLGRWYGVLAIAAFATVCALIVHAHAATIAELFVAQVCAQGVVNALKPMYGRPRPDDWLHRFERGFSYPSGHAATAAFFFCGLLVLLLRSPDAPRDLVPIAAVPLAACVLGIPWSRVALGAHYLTDVIGGALFGAGLLCACLALTAHVGLGTQGR